QLLARSLREDAPNFLDGKENDTPVPVVRKIGRHLPNLPHAAAEHFGKLAGAHGDRLQSRYLSDPLPVRLTCACGPPTRVERRDRSGWFAGRSGRRVARLLAPPDEAFALRFPVPSQLLERRQAPSLLLPE